MNGFVKYIIPKDGGFTWSKIRQYAHDDQQVGIKNFGYKDDQTEWYLESAYSIEGIRARIKTRDAQDNILRRLIHGVYFTSAHYVSEDSFIAFGKEAGEDGDEAIIWKTSDDGQTWSEIYRNKSVKGIKSMVPVSKHSYWALGEDGEILHVSRN